LNATGTLVITYCCAFQAALFVKLAVSCFLVTLFTPRAFCAIVAPARTAIYKLSAFCIKAAKLFAIAALIALYAFAPLSTFPVRLLVGVAELAALLGVRALSTEACDNAKRGKAAATLPSATIIRVGTTAARPATSSRRLTGATRGRSRKISGVGLRGRFHGTTAAIR